MALRYCPMCDKWIGRTICPDCGMPTEKAIKHPQNKP
jgi:hypothetical protein